MDRLEQAKQLNMLNNSIKFVGPTHILLTKKGLFLKCNQSLFLNVQAFPTFYNLFYFKSTTWMTRIVLIAPMGLISSKDSLFKILLSPWDPPKEW